MSTEINLINGESLTLKSNDTSWKQCNCFNDFQKSLIQSKEVEPNDKKRIVHVNTAGMILGETENFKGEPTGLSLVAPVYCRNRADKLIRKTHIFFEFCPFCGNSLNQPKTEN